MSSGASSPAAASTAVPFPKHGVRFPAFTEFIQRCGGRDALVGLTTTDVCERFIKPFTLASASSYCDLLKAGNDPHVLDTADVFISHAWKYAFLHVVAAVEAHFNHTPDMVIWFDLFSNNQHQAGGLPFVWWQTTFRSAIEDFKHTVLVLAPWNDPVVFTRAWCLFEIFTSVDTQSRFEVAPRQNTPTEAALERAQQAAALVPHFFRGCCVIGGRKDPVIRLRYGRNRRFFFYRLQMLPVLRISHPF